MWGTKVEFNFAFHLILENGRFALEEAFIDCNFFNLGYVEAVF